MSASLLTILGSALLLGIMSGVHCAGMCGGIVALAMRSHSSSTGLLKRNLLYNMGRIASYCAAGALAGAVGAMALGWHNTAYARTGFLLLTSAALILAGLQLAGLRGPLAPLEHAGAWLWRRIQPYTRAVFSPKSNTQLLMAGMIWGYLPCGLVYSALLMALASGSAASGAGVMLAFGLGTLPNLMLAGWLWQRVSNTDRGSLLRRVVGGSIAAAGVMMPLLYLHHH